MNFPLLVVTFLDLWYGRIAFPPSDGIASVYWEDYRDARGKRFDKNGISCAHRTERFGSVLVVTNLENGKSVDCPTQDRGPYKNGRVIDLSLGAGRVIECGTGTGKRYKPGLCKVTVHRKGYD